MRPKTVVAGIFLSLCIGGLVFASGKIKKFDLTPGYNKVILKWEVENEQGVKGYEIQRGMNDHNFNKVDFVKAQQTSQSIKKYEYIDKTVFKLSNSSRTFYYRLKIQNQDGTFSYSKVEHVTPTVSSARQTWGMIKAMFR
ncbi:MAG: hypothetical protein D6814_12010 [Calditrichaeota bacterium]|nr:MAG: hypothetical protein D6814_12010 [Calditrichota bacterium]